MCLSSAYSLIPFLVSLALPGDSGSHTIHYRDWILFYSQRSMSPCIQDLRDMAWRGIRCQKTWASVHALPLTGSGTLRKSHLFSELSVLKCTWNRLARSRVLKEWSAYPWGLRGPFRGSARSKLLCNNIKMLFAFLTVSTLTPMVQKQ